jgi:hypothetical protein
MQKGAEKCADFSLYVPAGPRLFGAHVVRPFGRGDKRGTVTIEDVETAGVSTL